jgi:hypothetical protein
LGIVLMLQQPNPMARAKNACALQWKWGLAQ